MVLSCASLPSREAQQLAEGFGNKLRWRRSLVGRGEREGEGDSREQSERRRGGGRRRVKLTECVRSSRTEWFVAGCASVFDFDGSRV